MGRPQKTVEVLLAEKQCPSCGERDVSRFSKNRQKMDGLQTCCKPCMAGFNKTPAHRHHLSEDRYKVILDSQNNVCAVCFQPFGSSGKQRAVLDHNHECCPGTHSCGRCVRGILHSGCNRLLGFAGDDPERLLLAAKYLQTRLFTP